MKDWRLLAFAFGLLQSCSSDDSSPAANPSGGSGGAVSNTAGSPTAGGNGSGGASGSGGSGGSAAAGTGGQVATTAGNGGVSGSGGSGGGSFAGGGSGGGGGSMVSYCTEASGELPKLTAVPAVDKKIPGAVGLIGNPEAPDINYVPMHFTGDVRVVQAGKLLDDELLHVDVRQDPPGKEQGLLSIVLSPKFGENHLMYVYYSAASPQGQSRIDEFELSDATHASFKRRVYDQPHSHQWHNGGAIEFGADGWLYVSVGDNQGDCGPSCSQEDEGPYGRIRKLDVAAANPGSTAKTFNKGLRNPWRWSFDPLTFDVVVGDVGDGGSASEKLFFASKASSEGRNWGWAPGVLDGRKPEGTIATLASDGAAIIGGRVYRGANPKLKAACGLIFYGHLSGRVYTIAHDGTGNGQRQELSGVADLSSFGVDARGELYKTHLGGEVFRIDAQ